jgi:hypothetical protein
MDGLVAIRPQSDSEPQTLDRNATRSTLSNSSGTAPKSQEPTGEASRKQGSDFYIPDAEAIKSAKAKRERMRNAAAAPDYLPLRGEDNESGLRTQKVGDHSSGSWTLVRSPIAQSCPSAESSF